MAWIFFFIIIISLLIIDLGLFNRKNEVMSFRKSLTLSLFYVAVSCLFGIFVQYELGSIAAKEYFTGFLLEKAMSVDNIFVISTIFTFFKVPEKYQHRVLFWGILGVIVLRALMIGLGAALLAQFSWVLYIFAIILIYTGVKMLQTIDDDSFNVNELYIYQFIKERFNIYPHIESDRFIIIKDGKRWVTPLFLALITIETMDLIFAIDSIPAIFAITQNTFIVYTSNIFAILGLRALFFCIVHIVREFKYIKYSLSIILILIGAKIFIAHYADIPTYLPLLITILLLAGGVLISIWKKNTQLSMKKSDSTSPDISQE
ncbi:MAG: hypothetical protein DGJ47_000772 [Rickettsiaceae bacterium]